jgi:asparagine synthase (glutamine-hydrolysing)
MTACMAHRGPDDEGMALFLPEAGNAVSLATGATARGVEGCLRREAVANLPHRVGFGHRRFSIIDLSAGAHQPFWSSDGQVCLTFNGEVYNYVEVRRELERRGRCFRTDSDTEVFTVAYQEWGVECFHRLNGFWAISLYDSARGEVLLARDRLGKAPLYHVRTPEGLFWASELKAIRASDTVQVAVDDAAVLNYVRFGWRDVHDRTFYRGIESFPSASYAWIRPDGTFVPVRYWTLPEQRRSENDIPVDDAVEDFRNVLTDAVRIRMRSDVPVGIELSGGLDSSSILALAAQQQGGLRTFTVSFPGTPADEEPFARKVIERYADRIEPTIFEPPADEFFAEADRFIYLMDEPFHSPNLLTNHAIWQRMARSGIRVSLNGAGGDEVLAGYPFDYHAPYLRSLLRGGRLGRFAREFTSFSEHRPGGFGVDYLRRLYLLLPIHGRQIRNPRTRVDPARDPFRAPAVSPYEGPSWEIGQRLLDNVGTWRMNYWLRSGNQSMMGVPIEVRAPFLDYRVVEQAFSLPLSYLIRDGWLKWILRRTVEPFIPEDVVWRRQKMGFPFPLQAWLGESRDAFFSMVGTGSEIPYVDLRQLRSEFEYLRSRNPEHLWRLMSLTLWWRRCVEGQPLQ